MGPQVKRWPTPRSERRPWTPQLGAQLGACTSLRLLIVLTLSCGVSVGSGDVPATWVAR